MLGVPFDEALRQGSEYKSSPWEVVSENTCCDWRQGDRAGEARCVSKQGPAVGSRGSVRWGIPVPGAETKRLECPPTIPGLSVAQLFGCALHTGYARAHVVRVCPEWPSVCRGQPRGRSERIPE